MNVQPFISWKVIACLGIAPSLVVVLIAVAFPLPGLAFGALAVLPINLLAIILGAFALGLAVSSNLGPAVAFAGIVAGLLVRVAGTICAAFAIHAVSPDHLTTALATLCALLLLALGGESLMYARRLLAPSNSESARA
jgi:hypothetical protein